MSEAPEMAAKVRRAAQMLLFQRHRLPGVKGWELRRALGGGYMRPVHVLRTQLENMGLTVNVVGEDGNPVDERDAERLLSARFYVTVRDPLSLHDATTSGWSIDDLGGLTVTLATIISRRGKAPRKEIERILEEKFPEWKANIFIERYRRRGYIAEDEDGNLVLDWRARAELDLSKFMHYVLGAGGPEAEETPGQPPPKEEAETSQGDAAP